MNAEPYYIQGGFSALVWNHDNTMLASTWIVQDPGMWDDRHDEIMIQEFASFLRISTAESLHSEVIALADSIEYNLVFDLAWDEDDSSLFMGGNRRISRFWTKDRQIEKIIQLDDMTVRGLAYRSHDRILAVALRNHLGRTLPQEPYGLAFIDLQNPENRRIRPTATQDWPALAIIARHMAWSADGRYFALASSEVVAVWDYRSWELVFEYKTTSNIHSLVWVADQHRLIVGEEKGDIWGYDLAEQREFLKFFIPAQQLQVIQHNNIPYLITRLSASVDIINIDAPSAHNTFTLPTLMPVQMIAITSDGRRLAYVTHFQTYEEIKPPVIIDIDPSMYA